jgi:hypothetical protein
MKSENFFFLHQLEVCFLGVDRFDRLVLTGVSVDKFLNFANFYLFFLHCLSVCLVVVLFCVSCLSVCLSYVLYRMYSMCEYSSVLGPRKSYKFQKIILYRKNRIIMLIFILNVLKYTEF